MSDKKNIDKLYQEAFKNFEASPSPQVWENIQARLKEEKSERKVIPLWIRVGGVAAVLALLLTVGNSVFNPFSISPTQTTISTEDVEQIEQKIEEPKSAAPTQIVSTDNADKTGENQTSDSMVEGSFSKDEVIKSKTKSTISNKSSETTIASQIKESSKLPTKKDELVKTDTDKNFVETDNHLPEKVEEAVATEIIDKVEENEIEIINDKPSILDAIAEQDKIKSGKEELNGLEHRWSVKPNIAPVYYSSIGSGSSIDPDFVNNPQSGDVNMSYGVQVSYALNNRLSIRTGLNNVDLSYSTSDLVIATGPVSKGLKGVEYGAKEVVVTAINRKSLQNGTSSNGFGELNLKSTDADARLVQSINYFEVPVELQYAILNKKFGLNLIGGVSTMFLGSNEISAKSNNYSSILGEANNLSSVSFSTNIGLGIDYKLSRRFVFNLEPMFKYQLNPYSDSSVDFKPYYIGVYSGLSFKF